MKDNKNWNRKNWPSAGRQAARIKLAKWDRRMAVKFNAILSQADVAELFGTSRQAIHQTERMAIWKLRRAFAKLNIIPHQRRTIAA
jgi:DNA-binding XRE family transcriptional regulator